MMQLITDFTKTFTILSAKNQTIAKERYPLMPERFRKLVALNNPYLPFYVALVE